MATYTGRIKAKGQLIIPTAGIDRIIICNPSQKGIIISVVEIRKEASV